VARRVALASGLTLSCEVRGDEGSTPPVVLLPGPTDSWRSYQPVLDALPSSVRAVAVSQRGHGDSDKPATAYRVEDFAGDVPLLLDALGIARAVLVGHSGSCLVARRVAIEHPDRVAGLVLEASPLVLLGDPGLTGFVESVVAGLEDPIDPVFARTLVADTSSSALPAELVDELVTEVLKVPPDVWREMFAGLLRYDDLEALPRIESPTLLLWGDGDALVPRDAQEELLRRLPNATLVILPGAGHTPRWEDPSRVAAEVAGFAERLPAAG
jgi:non-heme chloroperoxidase